MNYLHFHPLKKYLGAALCRFLVLLLATFLATAAGAQTWTLPVPAFEEQVWTPPTTRQEWIPPSSSQVWIPPTTQQVWVPSTTRQVWVPPVTRIDTIPAVYQTIHHPAVTEQRHHPAVMGVRTVPAVTETVHHPAVTETVHHEAVTADVWEDGYFVSMWNPGGMVEYWVDGYYDYDNYSEGNWVDGHWEEVWIDGYWSDEWIDGYYYTITVQEAYDEVVVLQDAYDEVVVIQAAYDEMYEISPAWTETVEITPARTEVVLVSPERQVEVVVVEGHFVTEEVPGYYRTEEVPGRWETVEQAGRYVTIDVPGFWSTQTIAASTLTITSNGQDITSTSWSTGRATSVPAWVSDFLNNPDWLLDEPDEGTPYTAINASFFAGEVIKVLPRIITGGAQVRKIGGVWVVVIGGAVVMTSEEAQALVQIYIMDIAIAISKTRRNPRDVMSYITYEKVTYASPYKVYSGRTSGWGTPEQVRNRRDLAHLVLKPHLAPAIINTSVVTAGFSWAAYCATRGREQSLIDWHESLGKRENAIRGVAVTNRRGWKYYFTSVDAFGFVHLYTGDRYMNEDNDSEWPPDNQIGSPFVRVPLVVP